MMSIFGRSATPTSPPRKHNHFVPDGYIPPKSRQKVIPPPTYARMLKGGGSPHGPLSRQNRPSPNRETPTPRNQNQSVLPYAEFSRPPSRPESRGDAPVDGKATLRSMLKNFDSPRMVHSDHEHPLPQVNPPSPSPSPYPQPSTSHRKPNSPRGVIKSNPQRGMIKSPPMSRPRTPPGQLHSYSNTPRGILKSNPPRGIMKSHSPRGILKKSSSSPKSPPMSRARTPPVQQYCEFGGDDDYTPPPSRQKKVSTPQSCGLGPSSKRSPPSNDGSQSSYGPITVVDKYDTRDSHVWQPHYPPGRVPPAKSLRGRPRVRNPNIIFNHVVNAQDDGGASCSSRSQYCEDEGEEEDEYCRKLYEPCAAPLDWDHDPLLRSIESDERQAYRQCKLEEYLHEVCARQKQSEPPERFESYLIRCYAYANAELNSNNSKHILGYVDDHLSPLDVWVLRLCRGTVSRLARMGTAYPNRDNELFLRILREECVALDSERGSLLRRHLNETERRLNACNEQERNYKKILLLSQRSQMGVMQHLRHRDWR